MDFELQSAEPLLAQALCNDAGARWFAIGTTAQNRLGLWAPITVLDPACPTLPQKLSDTPETWPTSEPAMRAIAMPADTNPHGDIFGGWLLCQMDLAGATFATRHASGRVVTVAITAMVFHRPVMVGDEVTCYCSVEKDRPHLDHGEDRELGAAAASATSRSR